MERFIMIVSLLGDWLLYTFPLYQGLMELGEYEHVLDRFHRVSERRQTVPVWWWVLPILKVHMEKKRAVDILSELSKSRHDREKVMSFINKGTAWFYVALAGWLKMVSSAYEALDAYELKPLIPLLIGLVILLTTGGILNAYYRISNRHQWAVAQRLWSARHPERAHRHDHHDRHESHDHHDRRDRHDRHDRRERRDFI